MANAVYIFCLLNLYTVFAIRRESVHSPNNEEKAPREANVDGKRDGKRKQILVLKVLKPLKNYLLYLIIMN